MPHQQHRPLAFLARPGLLQAWATAQVQSCARASERNHAHDNPTPAVKPA